MPYDKIKGHSECGREQIAVVSPTGAVLGCHDSEESANKQIAALMAQEDNSRWVDEYSADKVLAGEPVMLLPLMPGGYYRWGAERDPITEVILQQMLMNFDKRAEIPGLVKNLPLNIEHDEIAGKIGSIIKLEIGEGGLYAYFDLSPKGTELLQAGAFEYLSPEIVWDFEDITTGMAVGPTLVGAAVTNYPFFGEATAMYSDRAAARIVETFSMRPAGDEDQTGEVLDHVQEAWHLVEDLGFRVSDLAGFAEHPIGPLGQMFFALGKERRVQFYLALALCEAQEGDDGNEYPRSAYLDTDSEPWRYRVKSYGDGYKLQYDRRLVQQAYIDMAEHEPDRLSRHIALWEWNVDLYSQEGTNMPGSEEQTVSIEQFTALQEQQEEFARQIGALTGQVAERDARIEQMRQERVVERFSHEAEGYSALGVEISEYAEHMTWLVGVDPDGEHLEWFRTTLSTADAALAQSDAFRSRGTSEQAPAGHDPFARIQALMDVKAKERGVALKIGTSTYNEIMTEVMNENPALVEQYRVGLISGSSEPPAD